MQVLGAIFTSRDGEGLSVPINIAPSEIDGFAEAHARIAQEFHQVARRFGTNISRADGFNQLRELFAGRDDVFGFGNLADRHGHTGRVVEEQVVAHRVIQHGQQDAPLMLVAGR